MAHSQNKILLIVEGEKTEKNVFERLSKIKINNSQLEIIDIKTNIYVLYQMIKEINAGFDFDSTSTIEVLREFLKSHRRYDDLEKLKGNFPYIYLLFDFDFQDRCFPKSEKEKILRDMLIHFNDETENGLLLINYPMIESYRDCDANLEYKDFPNLLVSLNDIETKGYKNIVHDRGNTLDVNKYTINNYEKLLLQNIMKGNFIINGKYLVPNYEYFLDSILLGSKILEHEFEYVNEGNISILCTAFYLLVSYFGKKYYNYITTK